MDVKTEQARRPHEAISMIARAPAYLRFLRISLLFPCYFGTRSRLCGDFFGVGPVIFPVLTGIEVKKWGMQALAVRGCKILDV